MRRNVQHAELELELDRHGDVYCAELRFSDPNNDAELPSVRAPLSLDRDSLAALELDNAAYGAALAQGCFEDPDLLAFYDRVQVAVQTADLDLRIRLKLRPSCADLEGIRWELLQDPRSHRPLATSERTLFSRFMTSADWRPVKLRPKAEMKALIAVSAPSDLARFKLAEVDRKGETERARGSLKGIATQVVEPEGALTLEALLEALRAGADILYLVCHGMLKRSTGEPYLFLQRDDGTTERIAGQALVDRLAEFTQLPRLVVLASCESAGRGDSSEPASAQSSLAPRLAKVGVPAILAMQGKISMQTVDKAMPVFFQQLLQDGQIDRALAVARGAVRDRTDSWMPALYLRLKSGCIWYEPGFADQDDPFKKWKSITGSVRQGRFVPILGPDLGAASKGDYRRLAERLAETHGFPMGLPRRRDLAKVCQYLSVRQSRRFVRDEVLKELKTQLELRNPQLELQKVDLKSAFKAVVKQRRQDEDDPFRILSELGASVYVNAAIDPMMPLALVEAGAQPEALFCHWRKTKDNHPQERPYTGIPSAQKPIVHYAFGFLASGPSLVLTEDDFIDYLIAAADYKLIPRVVRGTLVKSSLIFLGFSFDDWPFRVLFRQITALEGSAQLSDYSHVGVQIDPAEHDWEDTQRAREYLESYFGTGTDAPRIDIFWGSAEDFLKELKTQLELAQDEPVPIVEEGPDDWISF